MGAIYLHVDCRVHIVHILLIQLLPQQFHGFSEALEVYDLPLPKELDHIIYIRVIRKPENIVIGHPCFLLWCISKNTNGNSRQERRTLQKKSGENAFWENARVTAGASSGYSQKKYTLSD